MNCPYPGCGGQPLPSARHCPACHQQLFLCPGCGHPARALARYCTKCGAQLPDREAWGQARGGARQTGYVPVKFPRATAGAEWRPHQRLRLNHPHPAALVGGYGFAFIAAKEDGVCVWDPLSGRTTANCLTGDGTQVQLAPAVHGRFLVACAASGRAGVRGRVAWFDLQGVIGGGDRAVVGPTFTFDLESGDEPVHPPVLVDEPGAGGRTLVLVATRRALLMLIEGQLLWRKPLETFIATPAVEHGRVWVLSPETMTDYALLTGEEGQAVPLRELAAPEAGLIADDRFLYYITRGGRLMFLQQGRGLRPVPVDPSEFTRVTAHAWDGRSNVVATIIGLHSIGFGSRTSWSMREIDLRTPPVLLEDCALVGGMDESDHGALFVHFHSEASGRPYTIFVSDYHPIASGPVLVDEAFVCCTDRGEVISLIRKPAAQEG